MVMPLAVRRFTVDDLDALPEDGNRHELLDGILLVTPAPGPPHQTVAMRLAARLSTFLEAEPGLRVWAPGVIVVQPSVQLEPDVLVGSRPTGARWDNVSEHWLAVEVSGTGSRLYDRDYKRDAYLELGVAEVWLVDLDVSQVFVSRRDGPRDQPYDRVLAWRSPAGRVIEWDIPSLFEA